MTDQEVLSIFKNTHALLEGHFRLSSGRHSPQYFQCAKVLQFPDHASRLCGVLAEHFKSQDIDAIVSPAFGGIVVGQEVGRQLGVRSMFTERKDGLMQLRRGFDVTKGERVLVCEDVITTGGSIQEVMRIVARFGGSVAGTCAIVDRSDGNAGLPNFHAVLRLEVTTYDAAQCPLCAKGIPMDVPGSRESVMPAGKTN